MKTKSPKATIGDDVLALDSTKTKAFEKALKTAKSAKAKKEAEAAENAAQLKPGIILLEHIPFGFFEKELRGFFSQFGKVLRVRVARSEKTGKSRGYAFIEFEFEDVAKIAAESMDGYLMFERLMKCKVLPSDVNSYKVFSKSYIRENKYPKLKSRQLVKKQQQIKPTIQQSREILSARLRKVEEQNKKLAELGIDYKYDASGIELPELEEHVDKEENIPAVQKTPTPKKSKKKGSLSSSFAAEVADDSVEEEELKIVQKKKKTPNKNSPKSKSPLQLKSPKPKELKEVIIKKSPKKSPVVEKPSKAKTPESIKLPRISPKLLRSRKSLPASAISLPVASKTPKREMKDTPQTATPVSIVQKKLKEESTESSITPKSLKKSPKPIKMESPVPEKFPKFSPKLLRSRKSDISSLTVAALSSKKSAQKTSASNKKASISNSPAPKTPKVKGTSTPAPSEKQEVPETKKSPKFPKFSPKLLRSRKSDASALQKKSPEGQKSKNKTATAGRKSVR